jgi:hypothetical protein
MFDIQSLVYNRVAKKLCNALINTLNFLKLKPKKSTWHTLANFVHIRYLTPVLGGLLKLNLLFYYYIFDNGFYEFTNLVGNDSDPASIAFNSLATDSINKS